MQRLTLRQNLDLLGTSFRQGWDAEAKVTANLCYELRTSRIAIVASGASRCIGLIAEQAFNNLLGCSPRLLYPSEFIETHECYDALILISASGDNIDAQLACDTAIMGDYKHVLLLTQNPEGRVVDALESSRAYSIVVGKTRSKQRSVHEGFLGLITLMEAMGSLLKLVSDALQVDWSYLPDMVDGWTRVAEDWMITKSEQVKSIAQKKHLVALSGYWGMAALTDLESKYVEGGLGWIEIANLRNYAHGRYMNSFLHRSDTSILLFKTPDDAPTVAHTFTMLSSCFDIEVISTSHPGVLGACELVVRMLYLFASIAEEKGVSVCIPEVPNEGRLLFEGEAVYSAIGQSSNIAECVSRMAATKKLVAMKHEAWSATVNWPARATVVGTAYRLAVTQRYWALGLDFDGTLVPLYSGADEPMDQICRELERIAGYGIPIGIFTGRGRSVWRGLRRSISQAFWAGITCFLYNGAVQWGLNNEYPTTCRSIQNINSVEELITQLPESVKMHFMAITRSSLDCQITIDLQDDAQPGFAEGAVVLLRKMMTNAEVDVVSSGRSIDIVARGGSKRVALSTWAATLALGSQERKVLRIGDQGGILGNDFELLRGPGGFSVDQVDSSPHGCFPVADIFPQVAKGPDLTLCLLKCIRYEDGTVMLDGLI